MKSFWIDFSKGTDIEAALSDSLGFFGSLCCERERWGRYLAAKGYIVCCSSGCCPCRVNHGSVAEEADGIVAAAVPEEGAGCHPYRADVTATGGFVTPGGVQVEVTVDEEFNTVELEVDFGRDSTFAATQVLAALANREQAAYGLLAEAAAELAAE